jgi:hypothetical protein
LNERGFFLQPDADATQGQVFAIALRHFMQTLILFGVPLTVVFIERRFGKKILLLTLCACEIVEPDIGCLPHISHVFDIVAS